MSCPGGSCGPEGLERRLIVYGGIVYCQAIAVAWYFGYRVPAAAMVLLPAGLWFAGDTFARLFDRVCGAGRFAWHRLGRHPERRYCPSCAAVLREPERARAVAGEQCLRCEADWCDAGDLARWLEAYAPGGGEWVSREHDAADGPMLCPRCVKPLEAGALAGLPLRFSRCAACRGIWVTRLAWTWFALNPPPESPRPERRPEPRAAGAPPAPRPALPPAPEPELALNRDVPPGLA